MDVLIYLSSQNASNLFVGSIVWWLVCLTLKQRVLVLVPRETTCLGQTVNSISAGNAIISQRWD